MGALRLAAGLRLLAALAAEFRRVTEAGETALAGVPLVPTRESAQRALNSRRKDAPRGTRGCVRFLAGWSREGS